MDSWDDDDIAYNNRVQLFADTLDSPLLTTTRSIIINSLQDARTSLMRSRVPITELLKVHSQSSLHHNITADLKKKKTRLTFMDYAAINAVAFTTLDAPVQLLPMSMRWKVIRSLMSEPQGSRATTAAGLSEAHRLYNLMREGSKVQLQGETPIVDINLRKLPATTEQYSSGYELCERIIHHRQSGGLENKSGHALYQSPLKSGKGSSGISIATWGDIVIIKMDGEYWATSWDDFLGWKSILLQRRNCLVLWSLDESLPEGLESSLQQMWEWQESCIDNYGNEGHELMKATESVFKARLMQIFDQPRPRDSFSLMIFKQQEKERKLNESMRTPLVDKLEELALSVSDPREAAELFGALKFSGFPYINPKLASRSSKEFGTKPSTANFAEAMFLRHQFCDMVLRGYIARHAKWPPLIFSNKQTELKRLSMLKPLVVGASAYPLTDWYHCRFDKFMDFDLHLDYLDMMDDKSLGLDSRDAWAAWSSLKATGGNYNIPDERSKKLIVRLLAMPEFDPAQVVREMRDLNLSTADICLALYPKEKEYKLEARLFVMLQFHVRYFLTLAEKNFKELMKAYLLDQSMTKGRKGTMQYLEQMSAGRREGDVDTVFIEIDLTRWNLLWQGSVVDHVSHVADDIFGMPCTFSRGHEIFENSTIVVRISDDVPDGVVRGMRPKQWPESEYVWRGHVGGFEGIIQGQWTACTQAELKLVLRDAPILGYKLLGQGDNQVLAVTFQRDHTKDAGDQALQVANDITDLLATRFAMVNQVVKPEECLVSRHVITYSKMIWANGSQIPTTLKHAATVAPVGTSYLPSLTTGLEAISSATRASADSFTNPSRAYLYYTFLFRDYLKRAIYTLPCSGVISQLIINDAALDYLTVLPSDLGGLPTQGPSDFLFGGVSDHLSASISTVVIASHTIPVFRAYLGLLESGYPWKDKESIDVSALLQDPFSVPLNRQVGADAKIAKALGTVLTSVARNKDISPILSSSVEVYDKELSQFLTNTRPFYPLLMADLRELSIVGVKKKIETKFVGTRTVQSLVRGRAPINYRDTVLKSDFNRLYSALDFLKTAQTRRLSSTLSDRAIWSRSELYRSKWFPGQPCPIKGVTTIHPFEARVDYGLEETSPDFIEFLLPSLGQDAKAKRGPHPGRWGDKTWEHRKSSGVTVIGKEKSVLAAKRLLLLESQLAASGNLKETIRQVLRQRTTVNEQLISALMPTVIGGVAAHRWDSTIEEKAFAWLGPIMITQHTSVQTDSMTTLAGGLRDFAFCFQEHIFFGLQLIRTLSDQAPGERHAVRLHYSVTEAQEILSHPVNPPSTVPRPPTNISRLQKNPLVSANELFFQAASTSMPSEIAPSVQLASINSRSGRVALMVHYFLDQMENPVLSEVALTGLVPPSGISLDVGTVAGVGMEDLVLAAGAAVALRAIEMTVSRPSFRPRASAIVGIDRLSRLAALPMARFANAPGIRDQDWVRRSGILIGPGKSSFFAVVQALTSKIRLTAQMSVERLPAIVGYRMILSQYAERATPSRVLGCMIALLLMILAGGSEKPTRSLFRKHLKIVQASYSEEERITHQIGLLRMMAADRELDIQPFAAFIVNGTFFRQVNSGFDETTRYLRKFAVPLGDRPILPLVKVQQKKSRFPALVSWFHGSPVRRERIEESRIASATRLIERNIDCGWSTSTISRDSLPALSTISHIIRNNTCALIGVGRGAMARDLFALGASKVVGADLLTDFPNIPSVGTGYTPPEIPAGLPPFAWQWSPHVFTKGGDWFDGQAVDYLTKFTPEVVVVDIQTGKREGSMKIDPLVQSGYSGFYVFREILLQEELEEECAYLRAVSDQLGVYKGRGSVNPTEFWFVGKLSGTKGWSRTDVLPVTNHVRTLRRLTGCPNEFWYPEVREQLMDYLLHGRARYDHIYLSHTIECLMELLQGQEFGANLLEAERREVFTTLAVLHVMRINRGERSLEQRVERMAVVAASDPPLEVLGIQGEINKQEWYRLMTRVIPRLQEWID